MASQQQSATQLAAARNSFTSAHKLPFKFMAQLFEKLETAKPRRKTVYLTAFRNTFLPEHPDADMCFAIYRLILPEMDKERQVYKLKEQALADVIAGALGIGARTREHERLVNWRKQHSGNFANNVVEVARPLLTGCKDKELTVQQVNDALDRLAEAPKRDKKVEVLRPLIEQMDTEQLKWLCRIILKVEMKLGVSEKTVLTDFHKDGEMVFNTCCDLRKTFQILAPCYPNTPVKREDLVPGEMVRPQLADRVRNMDALLNAMRGKDYIGELKFDGERIQLHKDGDKIYYYTRNMLDWGPRGYNVFDTIVKAQVKRDRCVLDGELVIWHAGMQQFVEFGSNKTAINMVRDAWKTKSGGGGGRGGGDHDSDEDAPLGAGKSASDFVSELEIWYMAFDILYDGDHSVIHEPLSKRQELLKKAVSALPKEAPSLLLTPPGAADTVSGAIKLLLPGSPWSRPVSGTADINEMLKSTADNGEEGVVFKDLAGKWQRGDRSPAWIKFKPDYLPTDDLDLLIIGGYRGTGRKGGKVSQFLCGMAETPRGGGEPSTFVSFCKVGTGMSDSELEQLREKLKDVLIPGGRDTVPACYRTTGALDETPHVWVTDPRRSVVLTIKADVRMVSSNTFASKASLRFPRVTSIGNKVWSDVFSDKELDALINKGAGRIGVDYDGGGNGHGGVRGRGRGGGRAGGIARRVLAPGGLRGVAPGCAAPNVAGVETEDTLFAGEQVLLLDPLGAPGSRTSKAELAKLIKRHGGTSHMAFIPGTITRVVTSVFDGRPAQADVQQSLLDVLSPAWLYDCQDARQVIPPAPRHRLRFIRCSAANIDADLDRFGDSYFDEVDEDDVKALLVQASGAAAAQAQYAAAALAAQAATAAKQAKLDALDPGGEGAPSVPREKPKDSRVAALAAAAAELAASRALNLDALLSEEWQLGDTGHATLRGCRITLLQLPPAREAEAPSFAAAAAAAADDAVRPHALSRLKRAVELHGGAADVDEVSAATTHLVALPHAGWAAAQQGGAATAPLPTVADVAAALAARDAQQAALLRARLATRLDRDALLLLLLSRDWLTQRLAYADAAAAPRTPGAPPPPTPRSDLDFLLPEAAPAPHAALTGKRAAHEPADAAGGSDERRVQQRVDPLDVLMRPH